MTSGHSPSTASHSSPETTPKKKHYKSRSMGNIRVPDSESSSLDSMELEPDSDTGMESMSSAETPAQKRLSCGFCTFEPPGGVTVDPNNEEYQKLEELLSEMAKLKTEKLDLLRQNVSCKTDIKKLKTRETQLASDLVAANDEITRLKQMLKRLPSNSAVQPQVHASLNHAGGLDTIRFVIENEQPQAKDSRKVMQATEQQPVTLWPRSTAKDEKVFKIYCPKAKKEAPAKPKKAASPKKAKSTAKSSGAEKAATKKTKVAKKSPVKKAASAKKKASPQKKKAAAKK